MAEGGPACSLALPLHMEDHFDRLPHCILIDIFDRVSDIKALLRCRSVSKRFRSLVPYASSLLVRVDLVLPISTVYSSPLLSFIKAVGRFLNLFFPLWPLIPASYSSPGLILRSFHRVRHLDIQLPASPMTLHHSCDRGNPTRAFIRYRATFGETLKKCTILMGFGRKVDEENRLMQKEMNDEEEVKERVVWVIRVLVDACQRHDYAARELVGEHPDLARLRMSDEGGEGVMEMDDQGLEECRKGLGSCERCRVPRVRMRLWYKRTMEVASDRAEFEGATLVVVSAAEDKDAEEEDGDEVTAAEAFGIGSYKEAAAALTKGMSYSLEMNSFVI